MRVSEPGNSVYLERVGVWWNQKTGNIHMTAEPHGFHTWVTDNAKSKKRYHPALFNKLAKCLRDAGAPHPPIVEEKEDEEADA
jgi:hypothetical protein